MIEGHLLRALGLVNNEVTKSHLLTTVFCILFLGFPLVSFPFGKQEQQAQDGQYYDDPHLKDAGND